MSLAFEGDNFSVRIVSRQVRSVWQDFEFVVRPEVALCIPMNSQGQMLLIRQYRVAVDDVIMEFPAGRVSPGEDPENAARREVLEEIGFRTQSIERLGSFLTAPHFSDELVSVFFAKGDVISPPTPTPKEDLRQIVEVLPSAIDQLIADGRILDSKSIAAHTLSRIRGYFRTA